MNAREQIKKLDEAFTTNENVVLFIGGFRGGKTSFMKAIHAHDASLIDVIAEAVKKRKGNIKEYEEFHEVFKLGVNAGLNKAVEIINSFKETK